MQQKKNGLDKLEQPASSKCRAQCHYCGVCLSEFQGQVGSYMLMQVRLKASGF